MSDFNTINNNDFMIEKIKERPINRKKLIRKTVVTVTMAVIFGLVACTTILLLEPVISDYLYPEQEPEEITFLEDENEMKPEDMLEEEKKQRRPWYVRTKDGYTYKIIADFVEQDFDDKVVYFKKRLENPEDPDPPYNNVYVVAFFPFEEVKFCGIEGFLFSAATIKGG